MKRLFTPKTLRGKIMTLTAGITLMITIITVAICFFVFQSFLKKNQIQSAEFNLQLVSNNINSDITDIIYLSTWCSTSNDVLSYLETFRDKEKLATSSKKDKSLRTVALATYSRLKEEYFNTTSSDYIERLVVASNNTNNILQILSGTTKETPFDVDALTKSDFFPILMKSPAHRWVGFVENPIRTPVTTTSILPIIRPSYSQFNSDIIGWVYLAISPSLITDYLKEYPLEEDSSLYLSIGEHFYQIRGEELIEISPDFTILSEIRDKDLNANTKARHIRMPDGEQRTMVSRALEEEGWQLYQILSVRQLNEQKQIYALLIMGICAIILSLGLMLMMLLNRTINQPVSQVKRKIDAISRGDFSRDETIEWDHEIGDIGKGINNLSRDVVNLMDKRIDDEKQKKDLEYQILQSQINPHFLYNTLNSIKWMATIQGASGIAEMTTSLARLMKNIAKGTTTLITLKEELDLIKDYFLIQQYRYGGSISIDYQIASEDLLHCMVHRFSLQPIIENSLFHGIEPKGSAGKILVEAHTISNDDRTDLQISITDNGIGMTPEIIDKVLHQDAAARTSADFFKQVGISNVNQRIKYDFGPSYGISIESVPGEYTTTIILIPYQPEYKKGDFIS